MGFGVQWIVEKITFPSPPASYSLSSHPELFFVKSPTNTPSHPGVPCMLYSVPHGAPVLLVHAHSNGCDIGDMRQTLQSISESLKVHVMSFEFPGYGLHVGTPNMQAIDQAAIAVADFIKNNLKVNLSQVVWYGRSIGSGPALRMAHRITQELKQQPGGVVVQCGFANFPEVAGHLFGRVAKRLVTPLWPNEAMMKELDCPVLLIHGRNDTMIPISQSEKLWDGVKAKDRSTFYTCDCGHNDFNFRRCTLRPIYDFLLAIISAPSFPATNFTINLDAGNLAYVHHIGPLRSKIPVYSFRRPELEEFLRGFQRNHLFAIEDLADSTRSLPDLKPGQRAVVVGLTPEEGSQLNGMQGLLLSLEEQEDRWWLRLDTGESILLRPRNLQLAPDAPSVKVAPEVDASPASTEPASLKGDGRSVKTTRKPSTTSNSSNKAVANAPGGLPSTKSKKKSGKGKGIPEPPIPDYSIQAPPEDVYAGLLNPEGMVRTCANRVAAFLDRLQTQLDRVEGLETKKLEEVVEMVEAEFWASDPLLCLWEEVYLEDRNRVRFRLGPFSIDNHGKREYDPGLGAGSTSSPALWLRQPMWLFMPSPAHFRCLAEWSLLHSARLERNLAPRKTPQGSSTTCCCGPSLGSKPKRSRYGRRDSDVGHPSRGILATSFSAHFVHWVEKKDEIKALFERFVALYENPESTLRRSQELSQGPTLSNNPPAAMARKELTSDIAPPTPGSQNEEDPSPLDRPESDRPEIRSLRLHPAASKEVGMNVTDSGTHVVLPCSPAPFSEGGRSWLRDTLGGLGSQNIDLTVKFWRSPGSEGEGSILDNAAAAKAAADSELLEGHLEEMTQKRRLDWSTASLLLHYERLLWGVTSSTATVSHVTEEVWGDPLRKEFSAAGASMSKAVRVFAQAELRDRREYQNSNFGPRISKRISRIPPEAEAPGGPKARLPPQPVATDQGTSPVPLPPQSTSETLHIENSYRAQPSGSTTIHGL